jgi:hypothetical protein
VALRRKVLDATPNMTLVNLNVCISGTSLLTPLIQTNHSASLSLWQIEIIKNVFSVSAIKAT